jgi:NAD(P)-dependent dehydrogenase (short-subunit alcohol dehydrogenase family)
MSVIDLNSAADSAWFVVIEALIWVAVVMLLLIRIKIYWKGGVCSVRSDIAGMKVVITGAAQGVGRATMEQLLKDGCKVIFGDRDRRTSEQTLMELRQENSSYSITYIPLDLANRQSVKQFAEEVARLHSHIDILVNNAGIMSMRSRLLTEDGIERQLAINYLGHFLLTHKLLPLLKKSKRPRICNLASMAYSNVVHTNERVILDLENINWQNTKIPYDDDMAYSRSKLAIVLSTIHLAEKLRESCP